MIYDEKTQKEHRAAVRRLLARSCDTVIEIQKEMQLAYGVEFDSHYIAKLMHKVRRDQNREGEKLIAMLATPEGRAEHLKEHQKKMAVLNGILAEITKG